jgi:glycine/D-amino acid oxidase-like deaminating enzyme/nitrite reductase/ring-hydroxylating ferredoxin subunit
MRKELNASDDVGLLRGIAVSVSKERTISLWMNTPVAPSAGSLRRGEKADVVVIGSGIAGLSTAYELARRGQDVVVLDRGPIGKGMTSRTTAHLTPICDDSLKSYIELNGLDAAKLFYRSQCAAVDRIEAIQRSEDISCNFRRVDGYLFPAIGSDPSKLDPELEAGRRIGVPVQEAIGVPFKGQDKVPCLRYPNQATFHPLKYLAGLASAITARNGRLYANTIAEAVEEKDGQIVVRTSAGPEVKARFAVVATNSPIVDMLAIHTKEAPYRTYAMAFTIPRGTMPDALYWDTLDPYHYVRLQPGPGTVDYLIVGGADHKTGEADDGWARFEGLESWIRGLLPEVGRETHRWSGQILDTIDYTGFIGRNPGSQNTYVATGDSGQGMTHGALAGLLLADLITDRRDAWQDLYDPSRKPISAIKNFVTENVTALKNFAEYVAPGERKSVDDLKPGEGAIIREGLSKIAAYRDEHGVLHRHSAACTHVGCHVHWNSLEYCWDCPCHGSHFAPDGTALNAPAVSPLAPVEPANAETTTKSSERV